MQRPIRAGCVVKLANREEEVSTRYRVLSIIQNGFDPPFVKLRKLDQRFSRARGVVVIERQLKNVRRLDS